MASTETVIWITSRFGVPILAFIALVGVFSFLVYPRGRKRKLIATDPLMSKKRLIPFYSSVTDERTALNPQRKSRTKHLRSYSAHLTPPTKYARQSPAHQHFRRNSSPTMSPHRRKESIDNATPKVEKLFQAYSLFPVQPFNWQLDSPSKRYSGSPMKSKHLSPRQGVLNFATNFPRMPALFTKESIQQSPLFNPDEKQ